MIFVAAHALVIIHHHTCVLDCTLAVLDNCPQEAP